MDERVQDTGRTRGSRPASHDPAPPAGGEHRETREAQRLGDGSPAVEPRSPAREAQETQGEPPAKGPGH